MNDSYVPVDADLEPRLGVRSARPLISVSAFEEAFVASTSYPRRLIDDIQHGSGQELTLQANRDAFAGWRFAARVLRDVSNVETEVAVLGKPISLPVFISPTGLQGRVHPDAEIATAQAAAATGTIFVRSEWATVGPEDVARAAPGRLWQQANMLRDRALMHEYVQRAESAGYEAICLTVDNPRRARRPVDLLASRSTEVPYDPSFGWSDLEWFVGQTELDVILKGVGHPDDAAKAAASGIAGIIVSNHGGRQLDNARGTLEILPEIVASVDGAVEVYLDGGIRTGADVVKALALGATAVGVGRPAIWGLAAGGREGVGEVLELLRLEIEEVLALIGEPIARRLDRSAIVRV